MARIAPFCGLRYNPEKIDKMEDVVSPPYDVIDQHTQEALFQKNPYNMIQLDLRKSVESSTLTDKRYQKAKDTFDSWQQESVLIRDQQPTLYLYFTDYTIPSGRQMTRKGLVALIGLAEFSEGIVKPHEKTFRGVTTDRLRLIDACRAHFSPIFSLYPDSTCEVMSTLEAAKDDEPLYSVSDQDGCRHTVWAVTDKQAIEKVSHLFSEKPIYIADGHHRYTTSLQLRELIREQEGAVSQESPFDYTMMYLCGIDDPGLSVLPTHRLVRMPYAVTTDQMVEKMQDSFQVEEIASGTREALVAEVLDRMDENEHATMFGFYQPEDDRCFLLTLKEGSLEKCCADKQPKSLQALDVVVLSDVLLECNLGLSHQQCEEQGLINYFSDPDEALDVAVKETSEREFSSVLFFMNPPPVKQVTEVADENLVMPHKSTYFYPKALTGLVLNKLSSDESIESSKGSGQE